MKKIKNFSLAIAFGSLFVSISALANQKICFGTGVDKGNLMTLQITSEEVHVISLDYRGLPSEGGYTAKDFDAGLYPLTKILSGTHRYDMGSQVGGIGTLLISSDLAQAKSSEGNAELRSVGDGGMLQIRFFCRNQRQ